MSGTPIAEALRFLNESMTGNISSMAQNGVRVRPSSPPVLKQVHDYLIVILLVTVMFAMGCSITWTQVWSHVKKPIGVLSGMVSQFVLLPLAAYTLIRTLEIGPLHAAGLLVLASSPGGVTSNIFTFFNDGDLSLSVTMTAFSTVVALVMMPFNLWFYGSGLETSSTTGGIIIPYKNMTFSLFFLTIPVVFGTIVHWKLPKFAAILTRVGSFAGFGIIVVCQTMEVFIFPDIFVDVPIQMYAAVVILPVLGLALGYLSAFLFKTRSRIRRTVAIECGIQNVGTALAIVSLSYPYHQLKQVWLFPFMYAFSMLGVCIVLSLCYQLQKRLFPQFIDDDEDEDMSGKEVRSYSPAVVP